MEQRENVLDVLRLVYAWRKIILGFTLLVTFSSAIISLFLPNYYQATTTFLAANPNQARPEVLFGKSNTGVELYGTDDDMDRILAIAASNELIDYLVDSFDLFDHYRINAAHPKARFKVRMHFRKLYAIQKTKLNALELTVEDQDPELAAAIANAARNRIDVIAEGLVKAGQEATLRSYEENLAIKAQQLKTLGDSLQFLRSTYQIFNTAEQSERLTERMVETQSNYVRNKGRLESMRKNPRIPRDSVAFAEALVEGLKQEVDSLNTRLDLLNRGQITIGVLENQYFSANGVFGEDIERAKLMRASLAADVPAVILVESAEVPVIKSRPKRSILVLTSGILSFMFGVLAAFIFTAYRKMNIAQAFK